MPASESYKRELAEALDVLHQQAKTQPTWVLLHTWEFRRLVYDLACGTAWDRVVKRPFIENASDNQRKAALDMARQLAENPDEVRVSAELSYSWRGLSLGR